MSMYAIDAEIPLPKRKQGYLVGLPHRDKYPWRGMQVGDSFLVRCLTSEVAATTNSLTGCRSHAQKVTGFKFVLRRVPGGIRVWRTA